MVESPFRMKPVEPPAQCGFNEELEEVLSRGMQRYVIEELRETPAQYQDRARALDVIEQIISRWVHEIYEVKYPQRSSSSATARFAHVQPYGSYLLDVHVPGSDIDSVVLLPFYVTQEFFLTQLPLKFLEDSRCTRAVAITAAKHKLITIIFSGLEFDLRPLILGEDVIPRSIDYLNDLEFKNVAQSMRESIAAVAANMWIKREVEPLQDEFKVIVRFLKQVIAQCGISGNKYGYFGGVNLALMVCFLMRQMALHKLSIWMYLYNFFYIFSRYDFSVPILVNSEILYENQNSPMEIVTPVKPEQNSTAKVTESGRRVIKQVFRNCEQNMNILMQLASESYRKEQFQLFSKNGAYKLIYMHLDTVAQPVKQYFFADPAFKAGYLYVELNADDQEHLTQARSKLEPMLVFMFNQMQNIAKQEAPGFANIEYIRPWPEWFTKSQFPGQGEYSEAIFIAISKSAGEKTWLIQQLKEMIANFKTEMELRFEQDDIAIQTIIGEMVIAIKGGKDLREALVFE